MDGTRRHLNICIFCSANSSIDRDFFDTTAQLGRWAATKGHTIVYGGVALGLMEQVAREAKEAGGRTVGVVPRIVEQRGGTSAHIDRLVTCADLHERKQLMERLSDVFVALPGGIGTLDEIFTIAASATIGYHDKPVILFDMKGFWGSLIDMLDDLHRRGVTRKHWREYIKVVSSMDELEHLLDTIVSQT